MNQLNPYASPEEQQALDQPIPSLSPPQTVKYRIEYADQVATAQFAAKHVPQVKATHDTVRKNRALYGLALLGIAGLLAATGDGSARPLIVGFLIYGCLMLVLAATYPFFINRGIRKKLRMWAQHGVVTESDSAVTCTLEKDWVRTHEPYSEAAVGWQRIERVRATQDHLFLFANPTSPLIIPARAFLTEQDFQAFCNLAQRLWEEHHLPRQQQPLDS